MVVDVALSVAPESCHTAVRDWLVVTILILAGMVSFSLLVKSAKFRAALA
jgi:hypothetical protein